MGTKTTQTSTRQFNPASMGAFNQLQSPLTNVLMQYMQDPQKSGFFNLAWQQALGQLNQLSSREKTNLLSQLSGAGFGASDNPALLSSMLARQQRGASGREAQNYINTLLGFEGMRRQAAQQAQMYQPLETGQTQVTQKSGLGTWLPQVLTAGASIAAAPFTGGASLMGLGGMMKGRTPFGLLSGSMSTVGMPGGTNPFQFNPFNTQTPWSYQSMNPVASWINPTFPPR